MNRTVDLLALSGIDTKSVSAKKGACSDIKNIRWNQESWENISDFTITKPLQNLLGYKIIYVHNILGEKNYIAEKNSIIYHINIDAGVYAIQSLGENINNKTPKITSFKNYLCFKFIEYNDCVERQFIYTDDKYDLFDIDSIQPLNDIKFNVETSHNNVNGDTLIADIDVFDSVDYSIKRNDLSYSTAMKNLENSGFITGAVYLFFGFKLFDGSIVKPSKIYMMPTQTSSGSNQYISVAKNVDNYKVYTGISGCKVLFNITLNSDLFKTEAVKSVVIFSTRSNPIYNFDEFNLGEFIKNSTQGVGNYRIGDRHGYLSDEARESLHTPFYELKEFDLTEFTENSKSVSITNNDYESIEFNSVYKPNYSIHKTTSIGDFEYNNRLHKYGIFTTLHNGYNQFYDGSSVEYTDTLTKTYDHTKMMLFVVHLEGDFEQNSVMYREPYYYYDGGRLGKFLAAPNIFSYPDARAKELTVYVEGADGIRKILHRKLKSSYTLNYSYYINFEESSVMDILLISPGVPDSLTLPVINSRVVEKNKLIVSNFGNPYSFDPKNTYFIGENNSTEIYSISSMISNENSGAYPLAVFASDGIYVIEHGTLDVLYQRIIKSSLEVALKTSDVLAVDKIIYFISSNGLMKFISEKTTLVSDYLDDKKSEYFNGAKLAYNPYYKEIIIYNEQHDYAYVYTINGNFWYRRDMSGSIISRTEFFNNADIVSLEGKEDETKPLNPYFITREIDYGNVGRTRLDVVVADMKTSGIVSYVLRVYGSRDLKHWNIIGNSDNISKIRRTAASWRYFKFEVDVLTMQNVPNEDVNARFFITKILIEFYSRFSRHLNGSDSGNKLMP